MSRAEEMLKKLSAIAEDLEFSDEDKDTWIKKGMLKKGFKPKIAWEDPEEEDNNVNSIFGSKKKKEQRNVSGGNNDTSSFFD